MKLSVIIPARNEDGSTDSTVAEVEPFVQRDSRVRLVHNTGRHGFGYAVRCGLDHYSGDAVVITMADGSDSPDDLVRYYRILKDKAECAFGSRWIQGSNVIDYPRLKKFINRFVNNVLRLVFSIPYNDITNAFKGYRRHVIDGCRPLISPHFNLTVELPLKALVRGYSYVVIPISWNNRQIGTSALKLQEMGSRYLFIVLHVLMEKLLTMGDYHRQDL